MQFLEVHCSERGILHLDHARKEKRRGIIPVVMGTKPFLIECAGWLRQAVTGWSVSWVLQGAENFQLINPSFWPASMQGWQPQAAAECSASWVGQEAQDHELTPTSRWGMIQ
eukprot:scaffold311869_cov18-Tisochrysis_lutea.AAC.1